MITIKTKSEVKVKVTVTRKWYATLCHPKMHPHTKFGIPTSKDIGECTGHEAGRMDGRTPNIEYQASLKRAISKGPSVRNNGPV